MESMVLSEMALLEGLRGEDERRRAVAEDAALLLAVLVGAVEGQEDAGPQEEEQEEAGPDLPCDCEGGGQAGPRPLPCEVKPLPWRQAVLSPTSAAGLATPVDVIQAWGQ